MTHYFFWKLLWKEFGGCIYAEMGWKREFEGIEKIEKVSVRESAVCIYKLASDSEGSNNFRNRL